MKTLYTFLLLLPFAFTFGQVEGTWKIAPQAAALGVGPGLGDISWWANNEADVTVRACFFDDAYVFKSDGTFNNVLGDETWVEEWQGSDPPACATPVAPHDGLNAATWDYNEGAGTITLSGVGAYLGLAKVFNEGELTDPADAPASITYLANFSGDGDTLTIDISIGSGYWRYILVKVDASGIFNNALYNLKIYPNPAANVLYLENIRDLEDVGIYTITGQLIYQSDHIANTIRIEGFPSGLYTLRANGSDGKQYFAKFMVE